MVNELVISPPRLLPKLCDGVHPAGRGRGHHHHGGRALVQAGAESRRELLPPQPAAAASRHTVRSPAQWVEPRTASGNSFSPTLACTSWIKALEQHDRDPETEEISKYCKKFFFFMLEGSRGAGVSMKGKCEWEQWKQIIKCYDTLLLPLERDKHQCQTRWKQQLPASQRPPLLQRCHDTWLSRKCANYYWSWWNHFWIFMLNFLLQKIWQILAVHSDKNPNENISSALEEINKPPRVRSQPGDWFY